MTGKPWRLVLFSGAVLLAASCAVAPEEAGTLDSARGTQQAALGSTATPYRGATVNSSVLMFGEWDWTSSDGPSRCVEAVERAAALGAETINFVPTHYFRGRRSGVDGYGSARLVVTSYCSAVSGEDCVSFDQAAIQRFENGMRHCFEAAVAHGMNLAVAPHLDEGEASGAWRNNADFDPLAQLGGVSYAEIMLYPLARAINAARGPSTQVYFALQAEMGETVFLHPDSYRQVAGEIRQMLSRGGETADGQVQVGLSLNFNRVAGGLGPGDIWDHSPLARLFENMDFVGLSAYRPSSVYPKVSDFDATVDGFAWELGNFGIDLSGLCQRGLSLHFSEFGIGGGMETHGDSEQKAVNRSEAALRPYFGIGGTYRRAKDPWVGDVRAFRRDYYVAAVHHFTGHGRWHLDKAFIWNIGSWDAQGLHHQSTNAEGSFGDDFIISLIIEHNRAVVSGEYLWRPEGIPTCSDPGSDPDGDGWGTLDGRRCAIVVPEP